MDPRQSLSRTPSANVQQAQYPPNMAATYAMPYQPHLPPIHQHHQHQQQQQPPTSQASYLPPSYRHDLPRVNSSSGSAQLASRYNPAPQYQPQGGSSAYSQAPLLPQPGHQMIQAQNYTPPATSSQGYQPRIAPAPLRNEYALSTSPYSQADGRPVVWSSAETVQNVSADGSREPPRTHVVGSQGRRGILPSAPGRAAVATNGVSGTSKGTVMPVKDADGKFPCPNCNKTYLHAKHLKRHLLRHTGDRPYMCVLCRDTFSRSDILKRHFQKCSVRRGNPTGASHLSNPAAHLKKSQQNAANAEPKSNAGSPMSGVTAPGLMRNANAHQNARLNGTLSSNSSNFSDQPTNPYSATTTNPNVLQRSMPHQTFGVQNSVGAGSNGAWASISQGARPNNNVMYHSASASPHNFGLPASSAEERKGTISSTSGVGDDWHQMFRPGENQEYMFPTSMGGGYDNMQSQDDPKKDFDQGAVASNNYYITPTSLGADGTLGPLLWNLDATQEDPLQFKSDRLVDFCFPDGLQDSLQVQQNSADLRKCLTADNIKHFLESFSNFQGHFPFLHMATFNIAEGYDGLILVIMCIGAVYSDRVSQSQVRGLMQRAKSGIERTSRVFQHAHSGHRDDNSQPLLFATSNDVEEIQAILLLCTLFTWHGGPAERASARTESKNLFHIVRRCRLFKLIGPESEDYSYLHHLKAGEQADPSRWNWQVWINQEMRLRVMYLAFLYNTALVLYFNCEPQFDPSEIKLPLPCDDAAWDATNSQDCASALGLNGSESQQAINQSGTRRLKQLQMHVAIEALYSPAVMFRPCTTNVFSKFILVHALHIQVWQVQRQISIGTSTSLDVLGSPPASIPPDDGLYSNRSANGYSSREQSRSSSPRSPVQSAKLVRSITNALAKWKTMWDQDMQLQYPPSQDPARAPRCIGFCRDGVHFYFLARAFLHTNRLGDWQLSADARFVQVMRDLRQVRDFGISDAARRGEEPGSVSDIDHAYTMDAFELDMKKLFRPIGDVVRSSVDYFARYPTSMASIEA